MIPIKAQKKGIKPIRPGIYYNGFWFAENADGYYRSKNGGGMLHRVIWVEYVGEIPHGYSIHHINGDRKDNRLENLEMVHKSTHATHHNTGRIYSAETCLKISESNKTAWKLRKQTVLGKSATMCIIDEFETINQPYESPN